MAPRLRKAFSRAARRFAPGREALLAHSWISPIALRLTHPSLWHLNRRSVRRAVPLGLLIAFLVPLGQVVAAVLAALHLRAHIPVAVGITFITNPFTLPFIYYAAYRTGAALLPYEPAFPRGAIDSAALMSIAAPLLVGFATIALAAAAIGYVLATAWWRGILVSRWRRRSRG
ncbi:MAG TPA: DUF2062 domain-containing protein [Allosphingosinicella sp.]|nr:DUF2062 domain-containing protein [Allosphingosinicella sp.]